MSEDHRYRIIEGDCIKGMATLPDGSVHTCVTSPPYWGLRDYGHDDQIGAERTPEEFVENMVNVFREVKRVLRDDGTVWLNLGDSYWSNTLSRKDAVESMWGNRPASDLANGRDNIPKVNRRGGLGAAPEGIKPKDLVGIPWRVAFALQADGWYLRQDIIWHKPNPMPEAVTDRCTKAHEYIFLLSKEPRYYYDSEAIKEPLVYPNEKRRPLGSKGAWQMDGRQQRENGGGSPYEGYPSKRNKRSVWTVTTKPFKGAHFATFPKDLIEPCILAGTSAHGCCSSCGSPYHQIVDHPGNPLGILGHKGIPNVANTSGSYAKNGNAVVHTENGVRLKKGHTATQYSKSRPTDEWVPACKCEGTSLIPCTVLDPFMGSGTTCVVALNHGRRFIGTELNPDYIRIARERIADEAPMTLMEMME